jgi:hypothetical protein
MVEEALVGLLEQQVSFVEEEDELGLVEVADLRQIVVDLGQQPHHECAEQLGPVLHIGHLEDAHESPSGSRLEQILDVEFGLAEEGVGALPLQFDDLSQDDADGGGRQPAVFGHGLFAFVAVQEVQRRTQVCQIHEGQTLVVGVLEDEGENALLSLVELQHLGEQDRAE